MSFSLIETGAIEQTVRRIVREEFENFKNELLSLVHEQVLNKNSKTKYVEFEKTHSFPLKTLEELQHFEKKKIQTDEMLQKDFVSLKFLPFVLK